MTSKNENELNIIPETSKKQNLKITAMTVCCVDIYPQKNAVYVGGNSVNFAVQCVKQGVIDTSVIGCVGSDDYGLAIINLLAKYRINFSKVHIRNGNTALNRIFISESGDRYFLHDSWDGGVYQSFILSELDWLFALEHDIIAIPANNPNFPATLERLGGSDKLVVDFLDSRDYQFIETVLPRIALGFISGEREMVAKFKPISEKIEAPLVITLGAEGSIALYHGKEYHQKAEPVETIVDTTGCGDSYQAAFTVSWRQGHNISEAMQKGASAAAETLKHIGGV